MMAEVSEKIVCKPTRWFLLRGVAMLLMFGIFAVLFYKDGSTGYREANLSYYSWLGVQAAADDYAARSGSMTPEEWREYASEQEISLPDDRTILPTDTPEVLPWPSLLRDYEAMRAGQTNPEQELFEPSMDELGLTKSPPSQAYDARKIAEQWWVFWICLVLFVVTLIFVIRTMMRRMEVDGDRFQPAGGKPIAISELNRLDLRRWAKKGLAYAWAEQSGGSERKIRIDGLTYGGFKHEEGEPAERLMQSIRARFSGEIIEYQESAEAEEEAGEAAAEDRAG